MNRLFNKFGIYVGMGLVAMVSLLLSLTPLTAQERGNTFSGKVMDQDGAPLVGATINIVGTKYYATTNFEGEFTIKVNPSDKVQVSFVGYKNMNFSVGNRTNVKIFMEPDESTRLNAAVSIGYGSVAKKDLTGSISSVNMEDIRYAPAYSVDNALQGRIAGADFMTTTGEPGSTTTIRIRGTRSITASNEPLIVVDGVLDAISDLNDINPDDIADISVLKDASATAIYGSRGSNGVILITTKQGQGVPDKINVSFKADVGFAQLPRELDIMNASEFAQYRNDFNYFGENAQHPDIGPNTALASAQYSNPESLGEGTDWTKAITRTAAYMKYALTVSQTTKKSSFYASFGYDRQDGIIKDSGQKRFTGRINLKTDFFKWLTVGYNGAYTWRHNDNNKATLGGTNTRQGAIYLSPFLKVTDSYNDLDESNGTFNNPSVLILLNTDYYERNSTNHVFTVDLHPFKNFVVNSSFSYYFNSRERFRYYSGALPAKAQDDGGDAYRNDHHENSFDSETTVTYKIDDNGHHADFLAGFSAYKFGSHDFALSGSGYTDDNVKWNNMNAVLDKNTYDASTAYSKVQKMSFFARVNWNYKSRYYLTGTVRYDGASNFAANHKWAFFPSGAFKWNIANEPFMKDCSWIDDLSIRLSAGVSGNDAISAFQSLAALGTSTSEYIFGSTQPASTYVDRLASPDLTWEKTALYNAALDWSMFNGRLNITAEAYMSYTTDLLLSLAVAYHTGFTSRLTNIGKTSNKGLELTIDSGNIIKPNFKWTTTFTISHNKQMVEDTGSEDYISVYNSPGNNSYMMYGYEAGYPLNALWGFKRAGIWHSTQEQEENKVTKTYVGQNMTHLGCPIYYDINHDGVLSQEDLCYLGNADPYIYGGLQNTFTIYGFRIGIYFAYSVGGKVYNISEFYMAGGQYTNQYRYMLNAWHPERNPDSDLPGAGLKGDAQLPSDFMVHDASFLRLKTLSVGYTFDLRKKCNWLRDITLNVAGDNIFLLKNYNGYDPDVSSEGTSSTMRRADLGAYPKSRTFIFSIQFRY